MSKQIIIDILQCPPISYRSDFTKIADSLAGGVMLSQAFYWDGKSTKRDDGFFEKDTAEMEAETGLTDKQQRTARAILDEKRLMESKRAGDRGKMCYRVNYDIVIQALVDYYENKPDRQKGKTEPTGKKAKPDRHNGKSQNFQKADLSLHRLQTKNTSENTEAAFSMLPQRFEGKKSKPRDEEAYSDFEKFCGLWIEKTGQDYSKEKPAYFFGARKKYGQVALMASVKAYAESDWHSKQKAWNLNKFLTNDVYKFIPKKEQDASVFDWALLPAELRAYEAILTVGDRFGGTWFMTTAEVVSPSFVEEQFKKSGVSVKVARAKEMV